MSKRKARLDATLHGAGLSPGGKELISPLIGASFSLTPPAAMTPRSPALPTPALWFAQRSPPHPVLRPIPQPIPRVLCLLSRSSIEVARRGRTVAFANSQSSNPRSGQPRKSRWAPPSNYRSHALHDLTACKVPEQSHVAVCHHEFHSFQDHVRWGFECQRSRPRPPSGPLSSRWLGLLPMPSLPSTCPAAVACTCTCARGLTARYEKVKLPRLAPGAGAPAVSALGLLGCRVRAE